MGPLLLASRAKEICETLVAHMYVLGSRALSILGNFLIFNRIQKVFLPANCCPVVYALLGSLDIKVQTLDLTPNLRNLNMNPLKNFLAKNSNEVTALLLAHTYGALSDFNESNTRGLRTAGLTYIIDDRCLCIPKFENFWADLTLFSFGYSKFIQLNQSGAIAFVKKPSTYKRLSWKYNKKSYEAVDQALRRHHNPYMVGKNIGNLSWVSNEEEKLNLSVDWILKTIPILVEQTLEKKIILNTIYRGQLGSETEIDILDDQFNFWRFNILIDDSALVLKKIFNAGLFASDHYRTYDGSCENSTDLSKNVINLFNGMTQTKEFCLACCDIILKGTKGEKASKVI